MAEVFTAPAVRIVRVRCAGTHEADHCFPQDHGQPGIERLAFDPREIAVGPWLSNLWVVWYDLDAPLLEAEVEGVTKKLREVDWARTDREGFLVDEDDHAVRWPVNAHYKVYLVRHPDRRWMQMQYVDRLIAQDDPDGGIEIKGGSGAEGKVKLTVGKGPVFKWSPTGWLDRKFAGKVIVGAVRAPDDESLMLEVAEDAALFVPKSDPFYGEWTLFRGMPHRQCKPVREQVNKLQYHLGALRFVVGPGPSPYLPETTDKSGLDMWRDNSRPVAGHFDVLTWGGVRQFQKLAEVGSFLALAPVGDTDFDGPPRMFDEHGELLPAKPLKPDAKTLPPFAHYVHWVAMHSRKYLNAQPVKVPLLTSDWYPSVVDGHVAKAISLAISKRLRRPGRILVSWKGASSVDWCNEIIASAMAEWHRRTIDAGFSNGLRVNHSYRSICFLGSGGGAVEMSPHKVGHAVDLRMLAYVQATKDNELLVTRKDEPVKPVAYNPRPGIRQTWEVWAPVPAARYNPLYSSYYVYQTLTNVFAWVDDSGSKGSTSSGGYSDTSPTAGTIKPIHGQSGMYFLNLTRLGRDLNKIVGTEVPTDHVPMGSIPAHSFGAQGGKELESTVKNDKELLDVLDRLDLMFIYEEKFAKSTVKCNGTLVPASELRADYELWVTWTQVFLNTLVIGGEANIKKLATLWQLEGVELAFRAEPSASWMPMTYTKASMKLLLLSVDAQVKATKKSTYEVELKGKFIRRGFKLEFAPVRGTPGHLEWWHYQGGYQGGLPTWMEHLAELGIDRSTIFGRDYLVDKYGFGGIGYLPKVGTEPFY